MTETPEYEYRAENLARMRVYATVGQGIHTWSLMEGSLVEIGACLMGTTNDKAGTVLYSIVSFHTWLSIFDDLFNIDSRFKPLKPTWNQIAANLRGLNDARVRLAHHAVPYSLEGSIPPADLRLSPGRHDRRSKVGKQTPLSQSDIEAFSNAVREVLEKILAFTPDIRAAASLLEET